MISLISTLATTIASTSPDIARAAFLNSAASPAQVLGASLLSFSRINALKPASKTTPESTLASITSLSSNIIAMIEGFAWHRGVMEGIAGLQLAHTVATSSPEAHKRIYDALLPNLFSEDSLLRLSSLQIALSLFPEETVAVTNDLIRKCIEVEEMPLSVQGAREKSMKLRKLGIVANGQLGRDGEDTTAALDVILRYLTGKI